jgi:hypothetical protein
MGPGAVRDYDATAEAVYYQLQGEIGRLKLKDKWEMGVSQGQ